MLDGVPPAKGDVGEVEAVSRVGKREGGRRDRGVELVGDCRGREERKRGERVGKAASARCVRASPGERGRKSARENVVGSAMAPPHRQVSSVEVVRELTKRGQVKSATQRKRRDRARRRTFAISSRSGKSPLKTTTPPNRTGCVSPTSKLTTAPCENPARMILLLPHARSSRVPKSSADASSSLGLANLGAPVRCRWARMRRARSCATRRLMRRAVAYRPSSSRSRA